MAVTGRGLWYDSDMAGSGLASGDKHTAVKLFFGLTQFGNVQLGFGVNEVNAAHSRTLQGRCIYSIPPPRPGKLHK